MNEYTHEISALSRDTVDLRGPFPKENLVSTIAEHVYRGGDSRRPGFFVIPDTRTLLRTKEAVQVFQYNLMNRLDTYFVYAKPKALVLQPFLNVSPDIAEKHYHKVERSVQTILVNGHISFKGFHMDFLHHLFVSLCYGPYRNIAGGAPKILDLLAMKHAYGYCSIESFIKKSPNTEYQDLYPEGSYNQLLHSYFEKEAELYTTKFDDLDYNKYPIIVLSNRLEDGIMHGATRARRKDVSKKASRRLTHCSIIYQ